MDKTHPFWRVVVEDVQDLYEVFDRMGTLFFDENVEQFTVYRTKQGKWVFSYRNPALDNLEDQPEPAA